MLKESGQKGFLKIFVELVGLFDTKSRAAATVVMLLTIFYLASEVKDLQEKRVEDNDKWRDREVELYKKLINRYDPKMEAISTKVDSTNMRVNKVSDNISETLNKINKRK